MDDRASITTRMKGSEESLDAAAAGLSDEVLDAIDSALIDRIVQAIVFVDGAQGETAPARARCATQNDRRRS